MFVLTALPIIRGTLKGTLTYFSKTPVKTGYLVTVPLRGRDIPALVVESSDARNKKIILKNSDYTVKKIIHTKPYLLWDTSFIKAARETSIASIQEFSEILLSLTPKVILDTYANGNRVKRPLKKQISSALSSPSRTLAIEGSKSARIDFYKSIVHKSLQQNESVFICVPNQSDAEKVANEFSETKIHFIFHSGISKKKLLKQWEEVLALTRPIVVVGTPQYLSLPRHFATIILEEEHSRLWKTFMRPFFDMHFFVEAFARATSSALILGAPILRLETHYKILNGEIELVSPRAETRKESLLIDPRIEEKEIKERTGSRTMQIFGKEIRSIIKHAQKNDEKVFLLVARKGLAPLVVCGDCGTIIHCPRCGKPLVLHKKTDERSTRIFSCHSCGFKRVPEDGEHETCPVCGGWRLETLGIGVERVEDEVKKLFPSTEHFIIDGDHTKTPASARKTMALFEQSKKGILIGTPMAIPLLPTISTTAVISLDSLLAIPDFSMNERIFALILALREKTKRKLIVQTRVDNTVLFEQALKGDIESFVKEELAVRKAFSYPPYGAVIKITLRGARAQIPIEMQKLRTFLSEYNPLAPQTMTRKENVFQMHMILKLKKEVFSDKKLYSKLHSLPPQFTIEVDPDNLL